VGNEALLQRRKRPNWWLLTALVLFHLLALYGLARVFAPDFTKSIEREVVSAFMVTVSVSEPPVAPPEPDEGTQGDPGKKATPREETAPKTPLKNPDAPQRPRTPSTGSANNSGAANSGDGSGRSGQGDGPGSGGSGNGSGNGQAIAQKPSVRSGNINDARDFPVPEGGRATRFGKSVTVVFTVTTDGLAKNCSVAQSSVDAQATSLVCGLVQQKIRFNPAINQNGQPVEARYGYRVDFRSR
jgi:protein TonB